MSSQAWKDRLNKILCIHTNFCGFSQNLFIHSFIHSIVHSSFIHSFIYSFIHSFTHSFIIQSFICFWFMWITCPCFLDKMNGQWIIWYVIQGGGKVQCCLVCLVCDDHATVHILQELIVCVCISVCYYCCCILSAHSGQVTDEWELNSIYSESLYRKPTCYNLQ